MMKKTGFFSFLMLFCFATSLAQEVSFSAEVSTNSVLLGNYIELKITLENANGKAFSPPEFADFDIISGPNQSRNTTIINGDMTQMLTYSYYIKPRSVGNFFIEPATIQVKETTLETEAIEIIVEPNPDNIIQNPTQPSSPFGHPFFRMEEQPANPPKEVAPKKKKRKTYRM